MQIPAVLHQQDARSNIRTAGINAIGVGYPGRHGIDGRIPIRRQYPAAVDRLLHAATAIHIAGKRIGAKINDIHQRIGQRHQRSQRQIIFGAIVGPPDADDIVFRVNFRRLRAAGAGGIITPIIHELAIDGVAVVISHAMQAGIDHGANDGVVLRHARRIIAENFMGLGQPLKAAGEHHLPVDGGDVFIHGNPRGIGGRHNQTGAGLDEPFEKIFVVRLVAFGQIVRGPLQISGAVAKGIAIGNGGGPERRILQNQLGAKGQMPDDILGFTTTVKILVVGRIRGPVGAPDLVDQPGPQHALAAVGGGHEVVALRGAIIRPTDHLVQNREVAGDLIQLAHGFQLATAGAVGPGIMAGAVERAPRGGRRRLALHVGDEGVDLVRGDGAGERINGQGSGAGERCREQ